MQIAQKLYQGIEIDGETIGLITYMRTDSVNLSDEALESAQKIINDNFGEKYHNKRVYKTKSKSAQEAHEAIRPTNLGNDNAGKSDTEKKLYNLIWLSLIHI